MTEIIGSALRLVVEAFKLVPNWLRKRRIKKILEEKNKLSGAKGVLGWFRFLK